MISGTGWTWEYIDENMTLYRLAAFTNHWLEYPPVHISFTGFIRGLGGKKRPAQTSADDAAYERDTPPKRPGFPDAPGSPRNRSRVEHAPDLPADMKDGQGYDAPDPKSPIFQRTISNIGGQIHVIKSKSPRLN